LLRFESPLWRAFGIVRGMNEYVTSPTLPTDGTVKSAKELSGALTLELNDDEIGALMKIITLVHQKYIGRRFDTVEQGMMIMQEMEHEIQTRLAEELEVLATIDSTPMLMGQAPILEIHGKLPTSNLAKYGMDHEKKEYEVKKATARDEDYLGQKGTADAAKTQKRERGWRNKKSKD
jgi:hypothetical protein